ncbi:cyclic nucleotide-binding domain-containing protein [Pseudomonas sp. N040]|uniref:cyclic nucleotide-binding domain-containing protein n=1 Tax=Pseudomonas sp. N040 TaxID=2785325 RepID=UPI0018A2A33B|nr:cyclic nucleotide-binding domain-containing protein [Pseudomonas sp. N040]MBF7729287.1 cyclic nucleotide-binding domain-containing protein [Pseudomonas sp. N040]MBW7012927.1 cyclic nucleotide-binding domain-containing protein [Pseudomonas sp. N040]
MREPLKPEQLRSFIPLNGLSAPQWGVLRSQLLAQPVLPGQWLFRRGDPASQSCFLLSGEVLLTAADGSEVRLHAGSPASLHALSPASPRQHEARALSDVSVLLLDSEQLASMLAWRSTCQNLLLDLGQQGNDLEWLECLLENPLFARVPPANVRALFDCLQVLELAAGTAVLREGDAGDCCYFLKSGRAAVVRGAGPEPQLIAELQAGACFGEEALLSEAPRNATVSMLEAGQLLRLERQDFLSLLKAPLVAEVPFSEAARLFNEGAQWLDVRLQDEYEQAHALDALHMPLHLLRLKARLLDPQRRYLCYCDTGKRSATAAFLLAQQGYRVHALRDGMDALPPVVRDGLLCERGAGYLTRPGGRTVRSR